MAVLSLGIAGFLWLNRSDALRLRSSRCLRRGLTISQLLKGLFGRERPPESYRASEILNTSFPSGHALLSAVVFLTLGAMLSQAAKEQGDAHLRNVRPQSAVVPDCRGNAGLSWRALGHRTSWPGGLPAGHGRRLC